MPHRWCPIPGGAVPGGAQDAEDTMPDFNVEEALKEMKSFEEDGSATPSTCDAGADSYKLIGCCSPILQDNNVSE